MPLPVWMWARPFRTSSRSVGSQPYRYFPGTEFQTARQRTIGCTGRSSGRNRLFDISSENIESVNVLKVRQPQLYTVHAGKTEQFWSPVKRPKKKAWKSTSTNNMITAGFAVLPETQHQYGSGSNGKYEFWDGADGGISDGDMTWGPKLNVGTKVAQWNSPIRDKVTGKRFPGGEM